MRVSAEWLGEYVGIKDAKVLAEHLERVGVEIEQIIYTPKLDKRIVVADVKKVIQHPDADRLKIVELSFGKAKTSVVCGASNVAEGQKVALVQPGASLPGGSKLEKATIRGVQSHGMIASAHELGLGDDKSGILVLESTIKEGTPLSSIWPESAILDATTAANRPDLLSVIGLSREIAASAAKELIEPSIPKLKGKGAAPKVKIDKTTGTKRYMAVELEADPALPSPDWMQQRLNASGIRPINAVVDITNYVLLEYGQPLHAFDGDKIKGTISVRHAKKGEKLETLDGQKRELTTQDVVIADSGGAIAMAGVMGGSGSEIGPKTKKIILESASFDGPSIRRSAIRHGSRTEASARFERGLPVQLAPVGLARAVDLLVKHAKGKVVSEVADELTTWPWVQHIGIRASKFEQMSGYKLSREEIASLLKRFQIHAEPFDIAAELKKHVGKPYVWGASYKKHGVEAFDCSYLSDYTYSLIGKWIGHTTLAQFETGRPVHTGELKPGDQVFYEGIRKEGKREQVLEEIQSPGHSWDSYASAIGSYFRPNGKGGYEKVIAEYKGLVGHNGVYVGGGKVIHAARHEYKDGKWVERKEAKVLVSSVKEFTEDSGYVGARRFVEDLDDYVAGTAPWWRPDLRVEEDLIEEVIRLAGFEKVPARLPAWQPSDVEFDNWWPNVWRAKQAMKALGFYEVMTYSFISAWDLDNFGYDAKRHLKLQNPLSREQAYLRSSLVPSLVIAAAKNSAHAKEFGLYEVSRVYLSRGKGKLPDEPTMLGVLFRKDAGSYIEAKRALEAIAAEFNLNVKLKAEPNAQFHPSRSAAITIGGKPGGSIGEIHPDILAKFKLQGASFLGLNLETLFAQAKKPAYKQVSRFPSVLRDLAVLVDQKVTWQEISDAIDADLADLTFLSDFAGKDIPAGKKSVAFRLEMSSQDKTLTDTEADERLGKILAKLKSRFGAEPRT